MIIEIIFAVLVGGAFLYWIFENAKSEGQARGKQMTEALKELTENPPKFPPFPGDEEKTSLAQDVTYLTSCFCCSEYRPWGQFIVLLDDKNCKVKKLVVNPKQRLSLQSHQNRDEHWTVVSGIAYVWIHETKFDLFPGETINIPRLAKHRIENRTDEPVEIIEVQTGDSFEETDITRYEDDWGRQ